MTTDAKPILIIGGGIAGITAAVEAAEVGCRVILVEREACLGGRVIGFHRYFPKMCPPTCGLEINIRRLRQSPRITVHTLAEVAAITGEPGAFSALIRIAPRYVTGKVSLDSAFADGLTSDRPDDFNLGMSKTKALYLPNDRCYPPHHVIDRDALSADDAAALEASCPPGAVDLAMAPREIHVDVGAIIIATGWRPYDAGRLDSLGFGKYENVITNLVMERLAAKNGPSGGGIRRPSDNAAPQSVAFVQCAGSRDDNHLPYCSAVCCMVALKQARYLIAQDEGVDITVFYIDIRAIGRHEAFYLDLLPRDRIAFVKGKVAKITEAGGDGGLRLHVEDTLSGQTLSPVFDMVVLSTGMVPNHPAQEGTVTIWRDAYGFIDAAPREGGIYAVGCAAHPCDVSRATKDATAAVLRAIQCLGRGA